MMTLGSLAKATTIAVVSLSFASQVRGQASGGGAAGYTKADVAFMQGMIHHHSQAIVMAAMAPTHGASPQLLLFCKKIAISQRDEIDLMKTWLTDRHEVAPDPMEHAGMDMSGDASMQMPGMLSAAQLAQLDRARGTEFDRLFLRDMIQHHEGALSMVKTLFDTPGSGQGAEIFGYATGVDTDQRAEIERMQGMLSKLSPKTP